MFLAYVNCLRYGPQILAFNGLTTEMALIFLFAIIYSSGIWYYTCHNWIMSKYHVRLADRVANVLQQMNTFPKVTNLKTIVVVYMIIALATCAVSTAPLYMNTFASQTQGDGEGQKSFKSVRLLPAQPNTTLYFTVLYVYTYVNVFQYVGFFTLVGYAICVCYIIGHAFGEITERLTRSPLDVRLPEENLASRDSLGDTAGSQTENQTTSNIISVKPRPADVHGKATSSASKKMNVSRNEEITLYSDLGIENPGKHFLQRSAVNAVRELMGTSDDLDLEILHLHHHSTKLDEDDLNGGEFQTKTMTVSNTGHGDHVKNTASGTFGHITSTAITATTDDADINSGLRVHKSVDCTPTACGDLPNNQVGPPEVRDTPRPGDADSRISVNAQLEDLRHYHLNLVESVEIADNVISTVVFTIYWQGIVMACFSLYALILGAFPQSEYFTLVLCIVAVVLQIVCCTAAGVWLNTKAHEPETALLRLDVSRLSDKEYRSMQIFLSQVGRPHIGITALGLLPVNRATYLTIAGTIITYAVVVLQFNSAGCQTNSMIGNFTTNA